MQLKRFFKSHPVDLSDHTTDNLACFEGLALGADLLERHFEYKRKGLISLAQ